MALKSFLLQELLKPALRRMGTATGTAIAAYGASVEVSNAAELVFIWASGIILDLVLSHNNRKAS